MNSKFSIQSVFVAILLVLSGCATRTELTGSWLMTTPEGKVGVVVVSQLRQDEYYFKAPGNPIAGVYELDQKKQLNISKPDLPRAEGSVWQIQEDGSLTLVAEPPFTVSGVRQISSKMVKEK